MKAKAVKLSPSRINSLNTCSWQYYCNYTLRLPQVGNDGSRRGTICHGLLEHLTKPKHHHYIDKMLEAGDAFAIPVINRYLRLFAKKEKLQIDQIVVNKDKNGLMTHAEEINNMLLVALKDDFLGDKGDEVITEIEHVAEKNDGSKRYTLRGFIDKLIVKRNEQGKIISVRIVDYKTSSKKFAQNDMESNMQGLVYQFFAKQMFPDVESLSFEFQFLRFPKSPNVYVPPFPMEEIDGFEHYLTYITKYMEGFTEEHAKKNFAKYNGEEFLCGRYGNKSYKDKKSGKKIEHNEPQFMCSCRDPFDYWAVIDADGNNVRTAFIKEDLKAKEGEVVVQRHYSGCPAWHAQKKSLKRDWSALQ